MGVIAIVTGVVMIADPALGLQAITIVAIAYLVADGVTLARMAVEPQFTILDRGPGQPELQLYMALNMRFK